MTFPITRLRRLRRTATLRRMVRETRLARDDLILPLFVVEGRGVREPVSSMPGVLRFSVDAPRRRGEAVRQLGIPAVILFGVPGREGPRGLGRRAPRMAWCSARSTRSNRAAPDLVRITDLCLCEYTDHGHCGIVERRRRRERRDARALERRRSRSRDAGARRGRAVRHDGRARRGDPRRARRSGLASVAILSYAAKYASAFYGPFREAAESAPRSATAARYQMDPPNAARRCARCALDLEEGADMLMVKPALALPRRARGAWDNFDVPLAAYQVSGEYAMIKAAAERGWIDEERAMLESLPRSSAPAPTSSSPTRRRTSPRGWAPERRIACRANTRWSRRAP